MPRLRRFSPAGAVGLVALLSGCFLPFPPWWLPADPAGLGDAIVVENATAADWVVTLSADGLYSVAVPAGAAGEVYTYGSAPSEVVLHDTECAEIDRLPLEGSTAVRIVEPGVLEAVATSPAADTTFVEYWECIGGAYGPDPGAGEPLPGEGGLVLLSGLDGRAYELDVAAASVRAVSPEAQTHIDGEHVWSPDGKRLAFSRFDAAGSSGAIYVADADGDNEQLLVEEAAAPRWSPDGTSIAYLNTDPFAGASTVNIVEVASGTTRELAEDAKYPVWSPDGTRVAFLFWEEQGFDEFDFPPTELRIIDADATELRTLAEAAPFTTAPAWSPDGTRIAFVAVGDDAGGDPFAQETVISVYDVRTDEVTTVASEDGVTLGEPAWSPDGGRIAFVMTSMGFFSSTGALGVVPAGGGRIQRLAELNEVYYVAPLWSPSGAWLTATRTAGADITFELVAVELGSGDEVTIAEGILAATQWLPSVGP